MKKPRVALRLPALTLLLALLLGLGSPMAGWAQTDPLLNAYQTAHDAYEEGDLEQILDKEKSLTRVAKGRKDSLAANVYFYVGEAYNLLGYPYESLPYYEQSLMLTEGIYGRKHEEYSDILSIMAQASVDAGLYGEGISHYQNLSKLDAELYGKSSRRYWESRADLGNAYRQMEAFDKALGIYKEVLKNTGTNDATNLTARFSLAQIAVMEGRYAEARGLLQENIDLLSKGSYEFISENMYVLCMTELADAYWYGGDYTEAELIYLNTLDAIEAQADYPLLEKGIMYNNLCYLYSDMGRNERARQMGEKALDAIREAVGAHNPWYTYPLLNMGPLLRDMGEYELAEQYHLKAVHLNEEFLGKKHPSTLHSYVGLARVYEAKGEYEKAIALYDGPLKKFVKKAGPGDMRSILVKHSEARLYLTAGRLAEAEKALCESFELRTEQLGNTHPRYAEAARDLAVWHWQANEPSAAEDLYGKTFDNYFHQIKAFFPAMSETEKARFYSNKLRSTFEEFNTLAVQQAADNPALLGLMYDYQLNTKGLIFYATQKVRRQIARSGDPELLELFEAWVGQKETLARYYAMTAQELFDQGINLEAETEKANRMEKELSNASSSFAKHLAPQPVGWKEVQAQLKDGEVAVEVIRFRKFSPESGGKFTEAIHYAALLVAPGAKAPQLVLLENGDELEGMYLSNYTNSIIYRMDEGYSYDVYWKPIRDGLKALGAKKIYFSPDGVYNKINLYSLMNPETFEYVFDELEVEVVTNTKDIIALNEQTETDTRVGKALFYGYPNYDKGLDPKKREEALNLAKQVANTVNIDEDVRGSLGSFISRNSLMALLPGTKKEVEEITKLYASRSLEYDIYMENEAVEQAVKAMEAPHTLHIATHGFFMEDLPPAEAGQNPYFQNPMLRSGLIMAGANSFIVGQTTALDADEDGIFTAYEAMNLNLDKTQLVVLSACETGLGEVANGEGVYGLQRAFRVAGADALIMSLWSVSDEATQKLMTTFYSEWFRTGNKKEAFHTAQEALKKDYPHPFYWGAFVMVGR